MSMPGWRDGRHQSAFGPRGAVNASRLLSISSPKRNGARSAVMSFMCRRASDASW